MQKFIGIRNYVGNNNLGTSSETVFRNEMTTKNELGIIFFVCLPYELRVTINIVHRTEIN